ncbi:MFS transporter [Paenibacillus gorillae]|uniref:MFS transporter n=1 Tax=Paenibacillus gorillae TaxID=1243662 RepID=UPI0004BA5C03|nr:MFS transporter [Paenibacillus gorillae]
MRTRSKIALLALAVTSTFGTMIAAPAVKLLAVAFPDTNPLLIQWFITVSSLFILPTLFMAGYLSRRFSRKSILVVGLLLYLIGGIGPAFVDSFNVMLAFRALLGLSIGLISPAFNALIAESFQGQERMRMNGFVTAINGIGGAVFLSIGGIIASYGWRNVFLTYVYAIVLLIAVLWFLPKFPPKFPQAADGINTLVNTSKTKIPRFFYLVAVAGGVHAMLYFLIPTNLSFYLTDNHIGSVTTVGYLSALSLIGAFIGGVSVTVLSTFFGKKLVPVLLITMAAGFAVFAIAHSVWTAALAVLLIGFAEGLLFPLTFNKTAEIVPAERLTAAISILLSFVYAFQFFTPLFMQGVQTMFHLDSSRQAFMLIAEALIAAVILYFIFVRVNRAKTTMLKREGVQS